MRTRHSAYSCEDIGWMIHFRFQILKRFLLFADLGVFSRSASASSCTVCQAYPEVRSVTSCDNSPTLHSTCCHFRLYLFELHNLQSRFWDMHTTNDKLIPNDERSCLRRRKKRYFASQRNECAAELRFMKEAIPYTSPFGRLRTSICGPRARHTYAFGVYGTLGYLRLETRVP